MFLIPLWIVACVVFWVISGVMPHLLAKTIGTSDGFLTVPISTTLPWIWADSAVARLSSSMISMASYDNELTITALTNAGSLAIMVGRMI